MQRGDGPRVSVLVAVHNAAATITRALNSVLAQSFSGFEVIVVNDGSTDETARELAEYNGRLRVIEDCLNGRRTVWDDPFKPGRNGLAGLAQRIEANSPLALVILMLGTNDLQSMHPHNAWHAAQGIAALVNAIRTAPIEPGMPAPPILVVAPPPVETPPAPAVSPAVT